MLIPIPVPVPAGWEYPDVIHEQLPPGSPRARGWAYTHGWRVVVVLG